MRKLFLALVFLILLFGVASYFFAHESAPSVLQSGDFFGENRHLQAMPDSVIASAGAHYQTSKIGEFFLGKHYRPVWAAQVKAKVFHMDEMAGGLRIEKLGGGMQTTSLTLTDSTGHRWALRSLDKDPISVLSPFWRKTFVGSFVRDQVSATNPYAALVVAPLAEALGIFHPTPRLVFVLPSDKSFKQYSELFSNRLFLIEEKYTSKASLTKKFGAATDLVETEDVLQRRYASPHHKIDQWAFARARLLDLLVSDWDRHEGQWDWAEYKQGTETWYKPIPKDRDQALCWYDDGLLPWLATRKFAARKFESFHPAFRDVFGLTINASFLDARALSEVSLADFRRIARELQMSLTDSVLQTAVRQLPPSVYDLVGQETYETLRIRRQQLAKVADEYYHILAKQVIVAGSDEPERFLVQRLAQGRTVVEVYRLNENGVNASKNYSRTFFASETSKIELHGLGGDDVFDIKGDVLVGSTLYVYGGKGVDVVTDNSSVEGWRKKTVVIDGKANVKVAKSEETDVQLSEGKIETLIRFRDK
ncbi:hypothetical protein GU926_10350 [Nibribacter ruber]|uniref:Uncharacterized protein n=1 Tax=Nibribacter ruber TaxID=2698458 RepID=A0A6P1NVS0_9BACT|nr:hypothetical protein [Nibribacter ruber]QHL87807.1 hypothetical protein GU926_10350 [Nibribacter ruber]